MSETIKLWEKTKWCTCTCDHMNCRTLVAVDGGKHLHYVTLPCPLREKK